MNARKTMDYYVALSPDDICQCAYCQNYVRGVKSSYPLVADYLQSMGIDIEKPFEAMPLEPDEEGNIEYLGVQYIVLGSKDDFESASIGDVRIDTSESHPSTNIEDEHFVIEVSPICLKWTM